MKCWKNRSIEFLVLIKLFVISNSIAQQENNPRTGFPGRSFQSLLRNNFPPIDSPAYIDGGSFVSKNENSRQIAREKTIGDMLQLVNEDSILKTIKDLENLYTRYQYTKGVDSAYEYILNHFQNSVKEVHLDAYKYAPHVLFPYRLGNTKNIWVGSESGIISKSIDLGLNWNTQMKDAKDDIYRIFFIDSLFGYAVGVYGNIYRTSNGGILWESIPTGTDCKLFDVAFLDSLHGWVCGRDKDWIAQILETHDGGSTWEPQYVAGQGGQLISMRFTTNDSGWVVGNFGWLASTVDGGHTWEKQDISNDNYCDVEFTDSRHGWIGAASSDWSKGYIYKTVDGGLSWSKINFTENAVALICIDFINPLQGWAGFWTGDWTGQILYSNDGGEHWIQQATLDEPIIDVIAIDTTTCLAFGRNGNIYRTTDGGTTWETRSLGSIQRDGNNVVAVKKGVTNADSVIVIGAHYDSSTGSYDKAPGADDNASGTAAVMEVARVLSRYNLPYTIEYVAFSAEEIGFLGSDHYVKEAKASGKKIKLMINFDMIGYKPIGEKWNVYIASSQEYKWPADLAALITSAYTILTPNKAYAAINYLSDQISFIKQGFPVLLFVERSSNPYIHSINDVDSTLNIPYEVEVVKAALATIASISGMDPGTGVEENKPGVDFPGQMALYGNYPNPFNSSTIIKFALSQKQYVELKVFDLRGREVATVANGRFDAGNHTIPFSASGLSSGIYVYRIKIGDFTTARKMVVVE